MNAKEINFPVFVINLLFQAPLRTCELLLKVLVFVLFCLRGLLDEFMFPLDLGPQILGLPLEVYNVRILYVELLHELFGYGVRSAWVASNAHMCEGSGQSIIRDIFFEEGSLHIKSDKVISIGRAVNPSTRFMPHNLVTHSIGSST